MKEDELNEAIETCEKLYPEMKSIEDWCEENKEGLKNGHTKEHRTTRLGLAWLKRIAEMREICCSIEFCIVFWILIVAIVFLSLWAEGDL